MTTKPRSGAIAQLLREAEEHERLAKEHQAHADALRFAAERLAFKGFQGASHGQGLIEEAIQLRAEQRASSNGNGNGHAGSPPAEKAYRREADSLTELRFLLEDGEPHTTKELGKTMTLSRQRMLQLLNQVPGVVKRGVGSQTTWRLRTKSGSGAKRPATRAAVKKASEKSRQKWIRVAELLRDEGPLSTAAIKQRLGNVSLTGIANFVENGYFEVVGPAETHRSGQVYGFKTMPPAATH